MKRTKEGNWVQIIRDRWWDRRILRSLHEGREIDSVASEASSEGSEKKKGQGVGGWAKIEVVCESRSSYHSVSYPLQL